MNHQQSILIFPRQDSPAQDAPLTPTLTELPTAATPSSSGAATPDRVDTLVKGLLGSLDDAKAEDVLAIELAGKTSIADTMLITSGRSTRHVGSIAERLIQALKDKGFGRVRVEGFPACDWVLIDAGDVIVHIFRPEVRGFYNLEKMWGADRPVGRMAG